MTDSERNLRPITDLDIKENVGYLYDKDTQANFPPEVLKNLEIVMADNNHIFVVSPHVRESTPENEVTEVQYEWLNGTGLKVYKISMNDKDKEIVAKQKHATAWFSMNAIRTTLKTDEKLPDFPNRTGHTGYPTIYVLPSESYGGYDARLVFWEELCHVEDMDYFEWDITKKHDESCLHEISLDVIVSVLADYYNMDYEKLLKYKNGIGLRAMIGEVYPFVVISYILKNSDFSKRLNESSDILLKNLNGDFTRGDLLSHRMAWRTFIGKAFYEKISKYSKGILELKRNFRLMYNINGV